MFDGRRRGERSQRRGRVSNVAIGSGGKRGESRVREG